MTEEEFESYWKNLREEDRELIKNLVIARIQDMPDNLKLFIGGLKK